MVRGNSCRATALSERALMVWQWERGWSPRVIAQQANTSLTTVYKWIRRWRQDGSVKNRPRTGRPRINPRQRVKVIGGVNTHLLPAPSTGVTYDLLSYWDHYPSYCHMRQHNLPPLTEHPDINKPVTKHSYVSSSDPSNDIATKHYISTRNSMHEVSSASWMWQYSKPESMCF